MTEQDEGKEEKKERRLSQEQYDMLKRCSEKKDMTEWNEWRKENNQTEIFLEGADLYDAHLKDANLRRAHLEGVHLSGAHLEVVNLRRAYLEGVDLGEAHLNGAHLGGAHLEGAYIGEAHLERANLSFTHMEDASFFNAHLEDADLSDTHIEDAYLFQAHLEGTNFALAILNDKTLIWNCTVDRNTDFRGVGLGNVRIDPGTRALLEYNIRRMNWEEWYQKKKWYRGFVQLFWWVSDYGKSTPRILAVFSLSAIGFALLYYLWGLLAPPGIVQNLFEIVDATKPGHMVPVPWYVVPVRALYFSVVTMTTLGFGDLHANPTSVWGHVFLTVQVILGYGILGALITRLNILFTTGGPSGDFAAEKTGKASKEPERNGNA
jgi:hypothetical protein